MLPILPLKAVLTPEMRLDVHLSDTRYMRLVERCVQNAGELAVVFCSDYRDERGQLALVGCQAKIEHAEMLDGQMLVKLVGLRRFKYSSTEPKLDIYYADGVEWMDDLVDIDDDDPIFNSLLDVYQLYALKTTEVTQDDALDIPLIEIGKASSFKLLNVLNLPLDKRQNALEISSLKKRFEYILTCLRFELEMLSFLQSNQVEILPEVEVVENTVLN